MPLCLSFSLSEKKKKKKSSEVSCKRNKKWEKSSVKNTFSKKKLNGSFFTMQISRYVLIIQIREQHCPREI